MTDLWDIASSDLDAEARALRLTSAKVAAAEVWPFLALAGSTEEFEHRLALASGHINAKVAPDLLDEVTASLRQDYLFVTGAGTPDDWRAQQRKGRDDDEDDDDHRKGDEAADRAWERRSEAARTTARGVPAWGEPEDAQSDYDSADEEHEDPNYYKNLYGLNEGGGRKQSAFTGSLWDNLDEPAPAHQQRLGGVEDWHERYRETHPETYDQAGDYADRGEVGPPKGRGTINGADIRDIQKHLPPGSPYKTSGLTFFHEASGKWVTAAAEQTPGNPRYPDTTPEQGPNTDPSDSGYQNYAPDPPNRTLDQYQNATPVPWGDNTPWAESPMIFSPPENGGATSGWTTPPQRTSSRREAVHPISGQPLNWGTSGPGGGLEWEHDGDHAYGFHRETGQEHAHIDASDSMGTGPMLHYYPRGDRTRDGEEMHSSVVNKEQGMAQADYHHDQARIQGRASRREAAPQEIGGYWNDGHTNPGYFDEGSNGITGGGADSAPPPITGNPAAGVADYAEGSEPLENRADWYGEMTNQPEVGETGMGPATGSRAPFVGSGFFDPHDASVRRVADDQAPDPAGGGGQMEPNTPQDGGGASGGGQGTNALDPNNFAASLATQAARRALAADAPAGPSSGGSAPAAPASMKPGGPGAEAAPPIQPGGQGNVPQTSKPRQTPGGGGGTPPQGGGMPQAPGGGTGGGGAPPPGMPRTSHRRVAEGPQKGISTQDDPSGVGDEFNESAYENAFNQRPRQDVDGRRPNTPQNPGARDPIATTSSPGTPGGGDDEDERREAALVRAAVTRAMAGAR